MDLKPILTWKRILNEGAKPQYQYLIILSARTTLISKTKYSSMGSACAAGIRILQKYFK